MMLIYMVAERPGLPDLLQTWSWNRCPIVISHSTATEWLHVIIVQILENCLCLLKIFQLSCQCQLSAAKVIFTFLGAQNGTILRTHPGHFQLLTIFQYALLSKLYGGRQLNCLSFQKVFHKKCYTCWPIKNNNSFYHGLMCKWLEGRDQIYLNYFP